MIRVTLAICDLSLRPGPGDWCFQRVPGSIRSKHLTSVNGHLTFLLTVQPTVLTTIALLHPEALLRFAGDQLHSTPPNLAALQRRPCNMEFLPQRTVDPETQVVIFQAGRHSAGDIEHPPEDIMIMIVPQNLEELTKVG